MLDKLSPFLRHLALLVIMAVLTAVVSWIQTDLSGVLAETALAPVAGVIVTVLLAVLTPLVRQYGVGRPDAGDGPDQG
mgnify:CR=1 FL=1